MQLLRHCRAYVRDALSSVGARRRRRAASKREAASKGAASPPVYRRKSGTKTVEVTKALAALKPLYGKDNVEIVTEDGTRVRGVVRSMKMTQALTKPSVKMERADGEIIKISFDTITEIIDHNH
ncbi:MAG TPA: hypothetical protein VGB73_20785 [Pyrinomonadaceae bacterium]|jgi:hypothetical protein